MRDRHLHSGSGGLSQNGIMPSLTTKFSGLGKMNERGMTLLEVVIAVGILGVILVPLIYLLGSVSHRYGSASAKKALFPLADELKMAVALDMKSYLTTKTPSNPPCSGSVGSIPLPRSQPLRSGVSLKLLTKADAKALPPASDFPHYSKALQFCQGNPAADLNYFPVDFRPVSAGAPWDLFNPPPLDFGKYESFDFCATLTCPPIPQSDPKRPRYAFDKACQYAGNSRFPLLVVMRYTVRSASFRTPYRCDAVAEEWPADAVGELSYLFLWSRPLTGINAVEHFLDSGIFYSNKSVRQ